jgi:hypothetical protein
MARAPEPAPTHTLHTWRARTRTLLAASFVATFITFQVLVPALKLAAPRRPTRFSWQMYANRGVQAVFTVVLGDGSTVRIRPRKPLHRNEVRYEEIFPPQLCRQISDARSVQVLFSARSYQSEFRCP